jgi:hypothetical protein
MGQKVLILHKLSMVLFVDSDGSLHHCKIRKVLFGTLKVSFLSGNIVKSACAF